MAKTRREFVTSSLDFISYTELIDMEHNTQPPAELKTGTTTVGLIAKDCVVLASDQRATMGYLIANKTAKKIYKITDSIGATIAGSVADAIAPNTIPPASATLMLLDTK